MEYFGKLVGAAKCFKVHSKIFLSYYTSNMNVNIMAQLLNGGGGAEKKLCVLVWAAKDF